MNFFRSTPLQIIPVMHWSHMKNRNSSALPEVLLVWGPLFPVLFQKICNGLFDEIICGASLPDRQDLYFLQQITINGRGESFSFCHKPSRLPFIHPNFFWFKMFFVLDYKCIWVYTYIWWLLRSIGTWKRNQKAWRSLMWWHMGQEPMPWERSSGFLFMGKG